MNAIGRVMILLMLLAVVAVAVPAHNVILEWAAGVGFVGMLFTGIRGDQ